MKVIQGSLLLAVFAIIPSYGSIIQFSGVDVLTSPLALVQAGTNTSDSTAFAFWESETITTAPISVAIEPDPGTWVCCSGMPLGTVPDGLTIESYLLYAAPATAGNGTPYRDFIGSITFSPGETVVGIMVTGKHIAGTDSSLGSPFTGYGKGGNYGIDPPDTITLSNNLNSLNFSFLVVPNGIDEIRIMTTIATPEPGEALLIGSGLIALACFLGSRQRRRVALNR